MALEIMKAEAEWIKSNFAGKNLDVSVDSKIGFIDFWQKWSTIDWDA